MRQSWLMPKSKASVDIDGSVPFISTNDVLTSWFIQATNCQHGLLAINWRDKLPGHSQQHAGNNKNLLYYRPADSKTPAMIRSSLHTLKRHDMSSFWERTTGLYTVVTNWVSFAQPNVIEGCQEELLYTCPSTTLHRCFPAPWLVFASFELVHKALPCC